MNLLARFTMLRTAALAMTGVADDLDTLKKMATILRIPALHDANAAVSLLMLQTLITTHGVKGADEVPDAWVERLAKWTANAANLSMSEDDVRSVLTYVMFGDSHDERS